jgi:hypothetical protein
MMETGAVCSKDKEVIRLKLNFAPEIIRFGLQEKCDGEMFLS